MTETSETQNLKIPGLKLAKIVYNITYNDYDQIDGEIAYISDFETDSSVREHLVKICDELDNIDDSYEVDVVYLYDVINDNMSFLKKTIPHNSIDYRGENIYGNYVCINTNYSIRTKPEKQKNTYKLYEKLNDLINRSVDQNNHIFDKEIIKEIDDLVQQIKQL